MTATIRSGIAMIKVLESWGVECVYGIPGGSFNSIMDALYERRDTIRYIQVRHEEAGALAAAAEAKLSGRVGVCFGTAGPGATHLFNGLYDAKMDHVPVVALVGQVASTAMNYTVFQELNQNPIYADVGVYNRTVMTSESLPHVVDEAIRHAYAHSGVAVVTIPVDLGLGEIPDVSVSTAANYRIGLPSPAPRDIEAACKLLEKARRPVLYIGQGARGAADEILALSSQYAMPIVSSVLAKGIIADEHPSYMGTAARVASKPGNETLALADVILFAGSDFPFARQFFPEKAKFIQIDVDQEKMGRRHKTDVAIFGDAKQAMRSMTRHQTGHHNGEFLKACQKNMANWWNWLAGFEERDDVPMRVEPVFREINRIAKNDAIFVADVGNCTIHAVRQIKMNGKDHKFTVSGWFATMGYGLPAGIGAKLRYPDRQVFTISGDGGFSMVMQEVITQVKYKLPIINIVLSNDSFGFIEGEQEDTKQTKFGVYLEGADYAKAAEAMGARGFLVTQRSQLRFAFDEAAKGEGPVVIDVKIDNKRPFPAENMILDETKYGKEAVDAFKKRYEVSGMPMLKDLL